MQKKAHYCDTWVTVGVMGGKWKAVILSRLFHGTKRFGELYREVPDITERMLTRQLRELERDKLIHREVYREVPPRVEYSLTPEGESLQPLLKLMKEWGKDYAAKHLPDVTITSDTPPAKSQA